jgi:hypothetical protein
MEKKESVILTILLLFLILISLIAAPVSALTLSFVDSAYLKNNNYVVTDQNGDPITNFNGSHNLVLTPGKSYTVSYQPIGVLDLKKSPPGDWSFLSTALTSMQGHLTELIVFAFFCLLVFLWRPK